MATKTVNILLKMNDQFTSKLVKAGKVTKEQKRAMDKCASSAMRFSKTVQTGFTSVVKNIGKAGAALAGFSFAGLTAGFVALGDATEEYRKAMGKLNTAYQAAGYSAAAAQTSYKEFYKILGDTDTATEASQLLAKLSKSEADVTKWTRIAAGVSGTFGDALPIEGLIESANETAKVGKVTGVLADALNWAGISEDRFNQKLVAAGNEGPRNTLIMETLGATYEKAADAFYANNKALVQSRANQVAMQKVTGALGEASVIAKNKLFELAGATEEGGVRSGSALAWIMEKAEAFKAKLESLDVSQFAPKVTQALTQIQNGVSTVWGYIQPVLSYIVQNAGTMIPLIFKIVTAVSALSVIASIATNIISFVSAAKTAITVIKGVGGAITALTGGPATLIMTAISLLVVGFVSLYNNSETFRNAINKLGNGIKTVFTAVKDAVVSLKDKFISAFETIRKKVSSIVEKIKGFLQPLVDLFNKVKDGVASIGGKIKGFFVGDASGHATGTPYFPGGPTRINEGGRGEIVDLPNGTRIIPHDVAKKSQGGTSIVVHVTVQGNVIGNRQYMEQTGAYIAKKIMAAQGVV